MKSEKTPIAATGLSLVLPGLGQWYAGDGIQAIHWWLACLFIDICTLGLAIPFTAIAASMDACKMIAGDDDELVRRGFFMDLIIGFGVAAIITVVLVSSQLF